MAYRPKRRTKTTFKASAGTSLKNPPSASHSSSSGPAKPNGEREVTVLFQFNGHTFEAYETLGLMPGSSDGEVNRAYERTLDAAEPSDHEFYHLAYKAISKKSR